MPKTVTFDPQKRYIFTPIFITAPDNRRYDFDAILDTGAPFTEFSGEALLHLGLIKSTNIDVKIKNGLQTQKYGKIILPKIEICSQIITEMTVYVSHFEKSWGIKALIGLDFFRQFDVRINYKLGQITTEPLFA
jgi:hypothetical protein